MTPRDVLERLILDQRSEIASICLESLDVDTVFNLLLVNLTEDELLELGLRIKQGAGELV